MVVYILSLVAVLAIAGLAYWRQHAAFSAVFAAYERMLDRRDKEYEELAGRLYYTKNLPPPGIEMDAEYKERRERQRSVENRPQRPHRIGKVDTALLEMEIEEARRARG